MPFSNSRFDIDKKTAVNMGFTATLFLDREDNGFGILTELAWEVHGLTESKVPLIKYAQLVKGATCISNHAKSRYTVTDLNNHGVEPCVVLNDLTKTVNTLDSMQKKIPRFKWIVVGHDVMHDIDMLLKAAKNLRKSRFIDALERLKENSHCLACVGYYLGIFKDRLGAPKKPKLDEWVLFLNVSGRSSKFHDAKEDVELTRKIYFLAVKQKLVLHPWSVGFQLINKIRKTSLKSKNRSKKSSWYDMCEDSDGDYTEDSDC